MTSTADAPLDHFRAAVLADPALERRLGAIAERLAFVAAAIEEAAALHITLDAGALDKALVPDILGLERFMPKPVTGTALPGPAWAARSGRPGRFRGCNRLVFTSATRR